APVFGHVQAGFQALTQVVLGDNQVARRLWVLGQDRIALKVLFNSYGLASLQAKLQIRVHQLDEQGHAVRGAAGKILVDLRRLAAPPGSLKTLEDLLQVSRLLTKYLPVGRDALGQWRISPMKTNGPHPQGASPSLSAALPV